MFEATNIEPLVIDRKKKRSTKENQYDQRNREGLYGRPEEHRRHILNDDPKTCIY